MISKQTMILLAGLLLCSLLRAQVKFLGTVSNPSRTLDALLSMRISNSDPLTRYGTIQISITHEHTGISVAAYRLKSVAILNGTHILSGFQSKSEVQYFENDWGRLTAAHGSLPPGNYEICYRFLPEDKPDANEAELCLPQQVLPLMPLETVAPLDSICDKRPSFNWTGKKSSASSVFSLVCVEVREGQKAEEAIINNPAVLHQTSLRSSNLLNFPSSNGLLGEKKRYAWQVSEVNGNIILNQSDVAEFSILCQQPPIPVPVSYAEAKSYYTGHKYYFTSTISFSFHNPYGKTKLWYDIIHVASDKKLQGLPVIIMNKGINKIDLLTETIQGLLPGEEYKIEIYNIGTTKHYLNFIIKE